MSSRPSWQLRGKERAMPTIRVTEVEFGGRIEEREVIVEWVLLHRNRRALRVRKQCFPAAHLVQT
jgi:hypothetical protein